MPNQDDPSSTLALRLIDLLAVALHRLGPWLVAALCLYLLREVLAGLKEGGTSGAFWLQLMGSVQRTRAFAFLFGFLAILYGLQQRELRRTSTARLTQRVGELERLVQSLQPGNSSGEPQ